MAATDDGGQAPPALPLDHDTALSMLAANVRARPRGAALIFGERVWSFAELDDQASRVAMALARRGVARGDRVLLDLQNVPELVVALLGTWKLGAVVVPANPMYKARELAELAADCGARLIVAAASLGGVVAEVRASGWRGAAVLVAEAAAATAGADDFAALLAQASDRPAETPGPGGDELALLVYTSGTTGPAKGAMITHRNVVAGATQYRRWMGLDATDVILAAAPLFHVTGLIGHIGASLASGAPVVLFGRFEAAAAIRAAARWRATFTVAAATAYQALLDSAALAAHDVSSLRKVWSGGAPVSPTLVERFAAATGSTLRNVYGMTETTSAVVAVPADARAPVDAETNTLSIGRPMDGVAARVVGDDGRPVAAGEPGELELRGPMIVPGYFGRPEESARALRNGWLATGDIVKQRADGWLFLVDRKKDLIVASGFKVWPREVEEVLLQHPAVREACVVGVADPYRGETVKAFVALSADAPTATPPELIDFCRARLAVYKAPRLVEIVAELPKTATGKLLRRALKGAGR